MSVRFFANRRKAQGGWCRDFRKPQLATQVAPDEGRSHRKINACAMFGEGPVHRFGALIRATN
jgi:hypothetical protein